MRYIIYEQVKKSIERQTHFQAIARFKTTGTIGRRVFAGVKTTIRFEQIKDIPTHDIDAVDGMMFMSFGTDYSKEIVRWDDVADKISPTNRSLKNELRNKTHLI